MGCDAYCAGQLSLRPDFLYLCHVRRHYLRRQYCRFGGDTQRLPSTVGIFSRGHRNVASVAG